MASAWRAMLKLLGLGGKKEEETKTNKPPVRYHPYDEVSDDLLNENRRQQQQQQQRQNRAPRYHPYDEVLDDQIKEKPSSSSSSSSAAAAASEGTAVYMNQSQPPRFHPYDNVELNSAEEDEKDDADLQKKKKNRGSKEAALPRMRIAAEENGSRAKSGGAGGASGLHYADVEIQPGPQTSAGGGGRGGGGGGVRTSRRPQHETTIYTEVRPAS